MESAGVASWSSAIRVLGGTGIGAEIATVAMLLSTSNAVAKVLVLAAAQAAGVAAPDWVKGTAT